MEYYFISTVQNVAFAQLVFVSWKRFSGAIVFENDLSTWTTTVATDLSFMFQDAASFTGIGLSSWDVSNARLTRGTFEGAIVFNGAIGSWNVASSVHFGFMFLGANAFNQDIGNWDVSSATNMRMMLQEAVVFNQDLNLWDTSKVNTLNSMFRLAPTFNGNIAAWDVSACNNFGKLFCVAIGRISVSELISVRIRPDVL